MSRGQCAVTFFSPGISQTDIFSARFPFCLVWLSGGVHPPLRRTVVLSFLLMALSFCRSYIFFCRHPPRSLTCPFLAPVGTGTDVPYFSQSGSFFCEAAALFDAPPAVGDAASGPFLVETKEADFSDLVVSTLFGPPDGRGQPPRSFWRWKKDFTPPASFFHGFMSSKDPSRKRPGPPAPLCTGIICLVIGGQAEHSSPTPSGSAFSCASTPHVPTLLPVPTSTFGEPQEAVPPQNPCFRRRWDRTGTSPQQAFFDNLWPLFLSHIIGDLPAQMVAVPVPFSRARWMRPNRPPDFFTPGFSKVSVE